MKQQPLAVTKRKRIASWWVRWNDLCWSNGDNLDRIKRRAEAMAKASVTTAMIFGTHFRWDYLPYFTLLHDYLATVAEELGKYGVELWDHHSVNLIHRYDTKEEMRHVMLHSGPHLPFSPSREAAASWEYRGKRLNDWRMIDVKTREPLYYPQYAAEGFCHRNPEFVEAYVDYVRRLVRETGITGLSADDPVHYMHYNSCACPYCRAELKARAGIDLPPIDDRSFWGNWENPAWRHWIDLRLDSAADFFARLSKVLPEGFRLTTCGSNSASPAANAKGSDAASFLAGCNYVNLEMSGNTPPYKHDPVTVNASIPSRLVSSSLHLAAARERGVRCFSTGFGFTEETANIVWAVNKMLDCDCWLSTLKDRLGLPDRILETLPNEWDIVGRAFGFEREHPALFEGEQIAQLGVYFSYETRKHTFFGNVDKGYYSDWSATLKLLFGERISPHTVLRFPESPEKYPLILVPSPAAMTDAERAELNVYLASGGVAVVFGPAAPEGCESDRSLPSAVSVNDPIDFFSSVPNGVWHRSADWTRLSEIPPSGEAPVWREVRDGLYYNPDRISEGRIIESLLELVRTHMRPMPLEVLDAEGYLITFFESADAYTVRMLAADFETDVDHRLDEMRFHRSRVNLINHVEPIGVTQTLRIRSDILPEVYTPFSDAVAQATLSEEGGGNADGATVCTVSLPEPTSFVILRFPKNIKR